LVGKGFTIKLGRRKGIRNWPKELALNLTGYFGGFQQEGLFRALPLGDWIFISNFNSISKGNPQKASNFNFGLTQEGVLGGVRVKEGYFGRGFRI